MGTMQVKLKGTRKEFRKWHPEKPTIPMHPDVEYTIDEECFDKEVFVKTEKPKEAKKEPSVEPKDEGGAEAPTKSTKAKGGKKKASGSKKE